MRIKKMTCILLLGALSALLNACSPTVEEEYKEESITQNINNSGTEAIAENSTTHESATDYNWSDSTKVLITLNGNSATILGSGVKVSGSVVTIFQHGNYEVTGDLTNGQLIVDTQDETTVHLILNGVSITCSNNAPIYIKSAGKTIINLAQNSSNSLIDGASYALESGSDEPNATLFSKTSLSIYGEGSLTITGKYNDGIASKDGLIIKSGTIQVTAADDGIRGKDYLIVNSGNLKITAGGDGLKSDNDSNAAKGYVAITDGILNITSTGDAIAATTDAIITGGSITIISGGGSGKIASSSTSSKGIKGVSQIIIDEGTFNISSADDAIHSNGHIVINGGNFAITTGDDGIHADSTLNINDGIVTISKSYEGIESAQITMNGGEVRITSSDDGLNAASGSSSTSGGGWGQPGGGMTSVGSNMFYMNGGYLWINASGDGVDANGSVVMTAGTILVNGPTNNGNGALDYDGTFKLTGGLVCGVGSSGMAMSPSTSSSIYSVLITLKSTQQANSMIHIETSAGEEIITYVSTKTFQSIALSSPKLTTGTTYNLYFGGSSTGTAIDGRYQGGTYTGGTLYTSFTLSSIVTKISK